MFDLGDTLVNFAQIDLEVAFTTAARKTYELIARKFPQPMPPFKKYRNRQNRSLKLKYAWSLLTGKEFNSVNVLRKCSIALGINVPDEFYNELAWSWYEPLAQTASFEDDAESTLNQLQSRGLKLGIISNTFVPGWCLDRQLEQGNILKYFPVRIYSCEFGVRKPRRRIFKAAARQLDVEPSESVFVGDKYRFDIAGARRAGMFAVLKSKTRVRKRMDEKTFHIRKLGELPAVIDKINHQFTNASTG